jgi:hypothetical protein
MGMIQGVSMSSLFGNDPHSAAMDSLIELGMARAQELGIGFETNQVFDVNFFRRMEEGNLLFTLTSLGTKTDYSFVVKTGTATAWSVQVIHVATFGNMLDQKYWRMMTLTCEDRSLIHARTGW